MHRILMAVLVALSPAVGMACTVLAPFEMKHIGGAELVITGEVTGYREFGSGFGAALVTVRVDEVLKGDADGEMDFVWNSGMAQGPHEARTKGKVLIGAMRGGRIAVSDLAPDARPDLPAIVQPYCGEVWMLPATKTTVAAAREVLTSQ